jgi:hypothetical protein
MTDLSKYTTKEELFAFMKANKSLLIAEKKSATKYADAISYVEGFITEKGDVIKAEPATSEDLLKKDSLKVKVVINTTNLMDSHSDVHMKGIWKKSVKEQKTVYLLQEHQMKFENVITDKVKASVKEYDWQELGFNLKGRTEALVFDAEIGKDRNQFMFEQYAKGYVKEHSVGMRYVGLEMAVNDERDMYKDEKAVWDKYINEVHNREEAAAKGYFWAVTEAKIVEGSAVVKGSNYATPTISVKENMIEPSQDTQAENKIEPQDCTLDQFKEILTNTLLKK